MLARWGQRGIRSGGHGAFDDRRSRRSAIFSIIVRLFQVIESWAEVHRATVLGSYVRAGQTTKIGKLVQAHIDLDGGTAIVDRADAFLEPFGEDFLDPEIYGK